MADLSPRLNVVLGGDLVSTRDVAGDELALSSVAVGPSACSTAGVVKRIGSSPRAPDASPPQRLGLLTISLCAQLSAIVADGFGLFEPFSRRADSRSVVVGCVRSAPSSGRYP